MSMSRTFQLLVVAFLVCSTAVFLLHLSETSLGLLLGILGLILVLRILQRWLEEYGRRTDPDYDKNYAAQLPKLKIYMMTTMMILMVVYVFPVSDWKFWVCMACLIQHALLLIRRLANSPDESTSASSRNDTVQSRKWQLNLAMIMTFLMVSGLFPVSDWKFWACMTWSVVAAVFTYWRMRHEQSAICTELASNTHNNRIQTTRDHS